MKVTVGSVKKLCKDAEVPIELVEQHMDAFCLLVMRVAQWQRKKDVARIRGWWFDNKDVLKISGPLKNKTPLFEVLLEEGDEDILE